MQFCLNLSFLLNNCSSTIHGYKTNHQVVVVFLPDRHCLPFSQMYNFFFITFGVSLTRKLTFRCGVSAATEHHYEQMISL